MTTNIGIRQLHQELDKVTKAVKAGHSFVVLKHATPIFRIEPLVSGSRPTLHDLGKLKFKVGKKNKNLSKDIDAGVYGI